jgi:hypothetical protein
MRKHVYSHEYNSTVLHWNSKCTVRQRTSALFNLYRYDDNDSLSNVALASDGSTPPQPCFAATCRAIPSCVLYAKPGQER